MRRTSGLAAAVVAVCALVACGQQGSTAAGAGGGSKRPSLTIASPADGSAVDEPFEVRLDSSVALGSAEAGKHHVYLYYDGATSKGSYDLVEGDRFEIADLGPGRHTIEASLRAPDHSDAGAGATITVTVSGSGEEGDGGKDDDDSGYDY